MENRNHNINGPEGNMMPPPGAMPPPGEMPSMEQMLGVIDMITAKMKTINDTVPVSGKREIIHLEGRDLETVYYAYDEPNAPMIFAFHGGGYTLGGCAMNDGMYVTLRDELKANVVSIGYRKAPAVHFPVPQEDCYDAVCYYMENEDYDFDRSRAVVFGGSAGAHASLAVTTLSKQRSGPKMKARLLVYPFCDADTDPGEKPGVGMMELPMYRAFNYITSGPGCPLDSKDPLVSPYFATTADLDCTIPTIAVLAENDSLHDEGEKVLETLKQGAEENGMDPDSVQCYTASNMFHGYFEYAYAPDDAPDDEFMSPEMLEAKASGILKESGEWTMNLIKEFWNTYVK